ncbi:hypothetical protein ACH4A8_36955 [Streptomyces vietnamensis]
MSTRAYGRTSRPGVAAEEDTPPGTPVLPAAGVLTAVLVTLLATAWDEA